MLRGNCNGQREIYRCDIVRFCVVWQRKILLNLAAVLKRVVDNWIFEQIDQGHHSIGEERQNYDKGEATAA